MITLNGKLKVIVILYNVFKVVVDADDWAGKISCGCLLCSATEEASDSVVA